MLRLDSYPFVIHEKLYVFHIAGILAIHDNLSICSRERARASIGNFVVDGAPILLGYVEALLGCLNDHFVIRQAILVIFVGTDCNSFEIGLPIELIVIHLDGCLCQVGVRSSRRCRAQVHETGACSGIAAIAII